MRADRFAEWVRQVFAQSPAVAGVRESELKGIPLATCVELSTGAQIHIQWVRTSPPTGDAFGEPEQIVTGQVTEPVKIPELATGGRLQTVDVEHHLAALLTNGGSDEVAEVLGYTQTAGRSADKQAFGLRVRFHSGAMIFGMFRYTLPAGQQASPQSEWSQRKEI